MKQILRYLAKKWASEQMKPASNNFFQRRMFADHLARYKFAQKHAKNKNILDIACGYGYGTHLLSKVAKSAVGVDLEQSMIDKASDRYKTGKKLQYICTDAFAFLKSKKETFDVVVSFETVEHLRNYKAFIKLLHKSLKENGVLMLSTPNKRFTDLVFGKTCNPHHVHEFYTKELSDIIRRIFGVVPKLFCVRPVFNNQLYMSLITVYLKKHPEIVKNTANMSGLDNIYVVKKR